MKFFLIHHSHTDIGYTKRQEKVDSDYVKHIKKVVDFLREDEKSGIDSGYKFNAETFYQVKAFFDNADEADTADFIRFVKNGKIGVSTSFLNATDLTDSVALDETLKEQQKFAHKYGIDLKCAMNADINGCALGFACKLAEYGVKYYMSNVHTHHGYYVGGRKQLPFYWLLPNGKNLFVWQGEHYALGDELIVTDWQDQDNYMCPDKLKLKGLDNETFSEKRLFAYLRQLKEDGYPYDFCPINISGSHFDNSPPNYLLAEFVKCWNSKHKDEIELEMVTLGQFFEYAEKHVGNIDSFSGDWTDWWSDGTISTPDSIRVYKNAVRGYHTCLSLDPEMKILNEKTLDEARNLLMLFSEHTWGHSESMRNPCDADVSYLRMRKDAMAVRAQELIFRCLDKLTESFGETAVDFRYDYKIHAVNPTGENIVSVVKFNSEFFLRHRDFDLVNESTGERIKAYTAKGLRSPCVYFPVSMKPYEHTVFCPVDNEVKNEVNVQSIYMKYGQEGIHDLALELESDPDWIAHSGRIVTPFYDIQIENDLGITSVFGRKKNSELITSDKGAFTPVYDITVIDDKDNGRRYLGRNRRGFNAETSYGRLINSRIKEKNGVLIKAELEYELKGCSLAVLEVTLYKNNPTIDVEFKINKDSSWNVENVYLNIPFNGESRILWGDKCGVPMRPRIDQLPGACADYYEFSRGIAFINDDYSVIIGMKDAPMIIMDNLKYHTIRLAGDNKLKNSDNAYLWLMNNFWETNFGASLGGFHGFRYTLTLSDETEPEKCLSIADSSCNDIVTFSSFSEN